MLVGAMSVAAHGAKPAKPSPFDPPDLNLEYRLHREFLQSQGRQGNVAPRGINENYMLQKGETLWTLSEMLYGDGQYWPRVWAANKDIANPHLVRPGHQLQFLMGSEDDTPAFRFAEEDDEKGLELVASNGQNPIVDIPPPEVPPKPVLRVPPSFPEWQSVFRKKPDNFIDDSGIVAEREKIPQRIFLRGYVQEQPVESVGSYLENDAEAGLPLTNQYVYVKVKRGFGRTGQKMLVVKDQGRLKRVNKQWKADEKVYLVQIFAELELRETTPSLFKGSEKENFETYRALVTKTTGLSANDCVLIPGEIQTVSLEKVGPSGSTEAQVIGSEKHRASALFSPGDLVFLNKGANQGVENGQLLDVFADRTIRRRESRVQFSPVPSATIKVVKTTDNLATAVLLTARDSVQQGDLARQVSSRDIKAGAEELEKIDVENERQSFDVDDIEMEDEESLEGELNSAEEL